MLPQDAQPTTEADCLARRNELDAKSESLRWIGGKTELAAEWLALGQDCRGLGFESLAEDCLRRVPELIGPKVRLWWSASLKKFALAAAAHNHLGLLCLDAGRLDEARPSFERAIAIRRKLRRRFPRDRENEVYLGGTYCNLAHAFADSDPATAAGYYKVSLDLLRHPVRTCECSYWDEVRQSWWCEQLEAMGDAIGLAWVALAPHFIDNAMRGLEQLPLPPGDAQ